jgi:hypothetical protein
VYSYKPGKEEERSVTLSGRHQIAKINQGVAMLGAAMVKTAGRHGFRGEIAVYSGV